MLALDTPTKALDEAEEPLFSSFFSFPMCKRLNDLHILTKHKNWFGFAPADTLPLIWGNRQE